MNNSGNSNLQIHNINHNKPKNIFFAISGKYISVLTAIICIFAIIYLLISTRHKPIEKTDYALNTIVSVSLVGDNEEKAINDAFKEIRRLEKLLDPNNTESDIWKVNNYGYETPVKVNRETFDLIKRCIEYYKLTDGAFDITVKPLTDLWDVTSENPRIPSESEIKQCLSAIDINSVVLSDYDTTVSFKNSNTKIDLGGVAKGYIADKVCAVLKQHNTKKALINLGGNIYALGKSYNFGDWKIGLQTPFETRGKNFYTVKIHDKSVVTSGAYERYFKKDGKIYHHIIDPKTGYPSESDLKSVTIISDSSEKADMLSTAVFVSGGKNGIRLIKEIGVNAVLMYTDNKIEYIKQ